MKPEFNVISPVDQSIYLSRPYASEEDIINALELSRSMHKMWQQTALAVRRAICHNAIVHLLNDKEVIAEELCWQMGRPIAFAGHELEGMAERAHYMIDIAEDALAPMRIADKPGLKRYIKRNPVGTCLIIAPWNYPFLTAVNGVIPALLSGNSVILKHSNQTPLAAERMVQAFQQAGLPEGVFQYLHLDHASCQKLVASPTIRSVTFTGSVAGGKTIENHAAGRFIPVGLELGGKDPAYIRKDANIEQAVAETMDGAFFNSGQSCCSIERVYVHERHYETYLEQAQTRVYQYRLGPANEPDVTLGPMVSASAADTLRKQINLAIKQGAKPLIDRKRFEYDKTKTAYLAPQILTDVRQDMAIMTEESFGPVLCVMPVQNDEEAILLMNQSKYGLTAAVFTEDMDAAMSIGEKVETGTFFVNRCDYLDPALAWTGVKDSGRGCSLSKLGFHNFTQPKSFYIKQLS